MCFCRTGPEAGPGWTLAMTALKHTTSKTKTVTAAAKTAATAVKTAA